jgi:hypothetical protein
MQWAQADKNPALSNNALGSMKIQTAIYDWAADFEWANGRTSTYKRCLSWWWWAIAVTTLAFDQSAIVVANYYCGF